MQSNEHLFTAQWKVDAKHSDKLINRNFLHWPFESVDPYVLPNGGTEGYVEHSNGMVLSILSDTSKGVDSLWGDCTFIPADWGS